MIRCDACGMTGDETAMDNHVCRVEIEAVDERPDGKALMTGSAYAMAIGLCIILIASLAYANVGNDLYSFSNEYAVQQAARSAGLYWSTVMLGSGLFSVGLLLWCTGYIAKAISFLPSNRVGCLRSDEDLFSLLRRSDAALYKAQADGRNVVRCADGDATQSAHGVFASASWGRETQGDRSGHRGVETSSKLSAFGVHDRISLPS